MRVKHEYEFVYTYVTCCTEQPIQAAKQTSIQPMKKHNTPSERASDREQNNGTENKILYEKAEVLHQAMSKHDPAHT